MNKEYQLIAGAHLWLDWTMVGPIKDRLYKFMGTEWKEGKLYYIFQPYKSSAKSVRCDYDALCAMTRWFKPFLITPSEMYNEIEKEV